MPGSLGAIENEPVRLLLAEQAVSHRGETPGSFDSRHHIFHLLAVHGGTGFETYFALEETRLGIGQAFELDGIDVHRSLGDVRGLARAGGLGNVADYLLDLGNLIGFHTGRHIAAVYHSIYGYGREAHHIISFQVGLDEHVCALYVLVKRILAEHRNELHHDVAYIVDLGIGKVKVGQVNSYHQVGSHSAGDVNREIVPDAAVHENLSPGAYGLEKPRDAHSRAHRILEGTLCPVLGLHRHQVGGHAEERNRQLGEIHIVLITDGHAGNQIVDIESVNIAGRQRAGQAVLPEGGAGAVVEVADLVVDTGLEILFGIVERD